MKTFKKLTAILLTLLLCTTVLAPTAFAAYSYTGIPGTTTTFDKYLVMDEGANVPNVEFTYAVTAGTAKDATTTTLAVLAGVEPTKVKIGVDAARDGKITFTPSDTTTSGLPTDETGSTTAGKKYATKQATVDFAQVTFSEPGVYRYIITESGTNQGVTNDTTDTRTLDVYIQDKDNNGTLSVQGYVMYSGTVTEAPTPNGGLPAEASKSTSFTNTYATQNLTFGKEVTGNQGSKDKYFAFTVKISGAVAGTKYTVDISLADETSGNTASTISANAGQTNVREIVVPAGKTEVTTTFYLQDGQYITIKGLAKGTNYEVTESKEDYTSTAGITAANNATLKDSNNAAIALTDATSGTIDDADIYTGYTNNRGGVVPTGVMLTVVPGVIIVAIAGVGLFLLGRKNKEEEA